MPLISCEINLIFIWSENFVIVSTDVGNENATFEIAETKLFIPVMTLSSNKVYYLPNVDIKSYNVIIDEKTCLINQ